MAWTVQSLVVQYGYLAVTISEGKHGRLHAFFTYQQMNLFLRKLLPLFLFLLTVHTARAYDFEVDGIYYNKMKDNTVAVTHTGTRVEATESYTGSINIPPSIVVNNVTYTVTSIGHGAFWQCGTLVSIDIPESVTLIDDYAFYKCSGLTSINIPNSVTSIGKQAFDGCSGLKIIKIPDGVTSIGEAAFDDCKSLTSVELPNGITSLENHTFYGCNNLSYVNIPNGVKTIGYCAFGLCYKITKINIPNSVTSIGENAFYRCPLSSINIPNSVTFIGENAFEYTNISKIYAESIEDWMNITFAGSLGLSNYSIFINGLKLTNLVVPDGIKIIGKYLFYGYNDLDSITLHNEVKSIAQNAFNGCTNVKKIVCQGDTPPVCGADALTGISRTECTLYVPETSGNNYRNTAPWSEFENIVGGGTETPDTPETCEAPSISFDNSTNQLVFESATTGAEYHYTIASDDMATDGTSADGMLQLQGVYNITAYASADGMYNSEKTTAKLLWVNATIEDVPTDIVSAGTQRGIVISTNSGKIRISGTTGGEPVEVYSTDGALIQSVAAENGQTVISGLPAGAVYVVKIGGASAKVTL